MADTEQIAIAVGRELDALVAEKVMGWSEIIRNLEQPVGIPPSGSATHCYVQPYSTSIAAAWEVLQKAVLLRKYAEFGVWWNGNSWIVGEMDERSSLRAYADTAPLAICRAALNVVGA